MSEQSCFIENCGQRVYAPAGTTILCKEHFIDFVTWRRKKGGKGLFRRYSGMTMAERDIIIRDWQQSFTVST
ncbi:MAG: hypothetical protein GKS05_10005 [Nitrospirales bacterium]|nr:hypothetical protein [Nitrospirales bacterium]